MARQSTCKLTSRRNHGRQNGDIVSWTHRAGTVAQPGDDVAIAGTQIYFSQINQLEHTLEADMRGDVQVFLNQIASDAEGLGRALTTTAQIDHLL